MPSHGGFEMAEFIFDANEPLLNLTYHLKALSGDAAANAATISISRAILNNDLNSAFVFLMAYALSCDYHMSERVGSDFVILATHSTPQHLDS
jgi:hypothetical protein